jgi:hypothetical protein
MAPMAPHVHSTNLAEGEAEGNKFYTAFVIDSNIPNIEGINKGEQ